MLYETAALTVFWIGVAVLALIGGCLLLPSRGGRIGIAGCLRNTTSGSADPFRVQAMAVSMMVALSYGHEAVATASLAGADGSGLPVPSALELGALLVSLSAYVGRKGVHSFLMAAGARRHMSRIDRWKA